MVWLGSKIIQKKKEKKRHNVPDMQKQIWILLRSVFYTANITNIWYTKDEDKCWKIQGKLQ